MHRNFEYPLHTGKNPGPWSYLILHPHSDAPHQEQISFIILESSTADPILGCPWMSQYSLLVSWNMARVHESIIRVTFVSKTVHYLSRNIPTTVWCNFNHLLPTSFPRTPPPLRVLKIPTTKKNFPHKYRGFQDVFTKQLATKLPPHTPWNSAIDLLPGAILPKAKILSSYCPS